MSVVYNADIYFNESVYKDLLRWKRIIERRVINGTYPCEGIDSQDIISRVINLINKWVV